MDQSHPSLFGLAEDLGVFVVGHDYVELLSAIHKRETKLMVLRHAVERQIAGIITATKVDK